MYSNDNNNANNIFITINLTITYNVVYYFATKFQIFVEDYLFKIEEYL